MRLHGRHEPVSLDPHPLPHQDPNGRFRVYHDPLLVRYPGIQGCHHDKMLSSVVCKAVSDMIRERREDDSSCFLA